MLARIATFIDASVGRRLAIGLATTLLAGLALCTSLFVRDERREMQEILFEKGKTAIDITSMRIARALDTNSRLNLEEELRPVLEDRDFDYAYVFDDTRILATASDAGVVFNPQMPRPLLGSLHPGRQTPRIAGEYMEIVMPVESNGRTAAGLALGVSLDLMARQGRRIRLRLLLVTAGLISSALVVSFWWTRRMLGPLLELTRGAQRLSAGDLSVRVPVDSIDEIGSLATTFNQLADSLQRTIREKDRALTETNRLYRNLKVARARLGRAERLSAVGMLAAGVSHELNNPLGIILATAGNLREGLDARNPWQEDIAIIEQETERCRRIIEGLLNFAASGESDPVEVDINALLRETFALVVRDERARNLAAAWALDPHLPLLLIDPRQMQQVFLNLLLNAADAMDGPGVVTVRSAESIDGGQRKVLIEFIDGGSGIHPNDLDHIFDPFYTTKKGGAGYGLGLAVSYGIVAGHGGEITVASELGRGSTFTITLPVRFDASHAQTHEHMR